MNRMYTKRFDVSKTTSVALRPRAGHSRSSFAVLAVVPSHLEFRESFLEDPHSKGAREGRLNHGVGVGRCRSRCIGGEHT